MQKLPTTGPSRNEFTALSDQIALMKFGTWEAVTLPYNVPGDGFVYVYFNPSSASGGRTRLSYTQGSLTNQITAVANDGNGVSAFAPVTRNAQITQQELSGGSITVRYLTCFG